jgi:glycosyltransferase involved in cell wall biosynthesis
MDMTCHKEMIEMKISLISTTTFPTPPADYGGEIYVSWLCEALCKLGHEVTLFATYDSMIPRNGRLIPLRKTPPGDWVHMLDAEVDVLRRHTDILKQSDVVHDFSHNGQIAKWCLENNVPHCNTLWGISYVGSSLSGAFNRSNVVCWSNIHKQIGTLPEEGFNNTIYAQWHPFSQTIRPTTKVVMGGVDTDYYSPDLSIAREDWFLFLARAHPSKGIDTVIEIARKNPYVLIVIAGSYSGLHKQDGDKYKAIIETLPNIRIIEDPNKEQKRNLYRRCKAFLFPVQYCEAFGLVVAEAMSTGAPLIVSDRGSMPELVENSVNGFVCRDIMHYENAICNIDYINPLNVREHCIEHFSMERVARDYIDVYKCAIDGEIW